MTDALDSVDYQPEQMPHLTECLYCPGVRVCVHACVCVCGRRVVVYALLQLTKIGRDLHRRAS